MDRDSIVHGIITKYANSSEMLCKYYCTQYICAHFSFIRKKNLIIAFNRIFYFNHEFNNIDETYQVI